LQIRKLRLREVIQLVSGKVVISTEVSLTPRARRADSGRPAACGMKEPSPRIRGPWSGKDPWTTSRAISSFYR